VPQVVLALLLASSPGEWSALDTGLELSYASLVAVDMMQTQSSVSRGGLELNPILGKRPSAVGIAGYGLGLVAVHLGISMALPSPWRSVWQGITVGIEGHTVVRNYEVGVRIAW
jgi:hypothetical protein